jgi:plastocyanin
MKKILLAIFFVLLAGAAMAEEREARTAFVPLAEDGVQRVEVVGGDYYFDPAHIVVRVGLPVELLVTKTAGIVPHNIVIEGQEAGGKVRESISTDPKAIRFTPQKTGSFAIYCDKKLLFFPSHRVKGMEGVLEVTE